MAVTGLARQRVIGLCPATAGAACDERRNHGGQPLEGRRLAGTPESARGSEPGVVNEHHQHVRAPPEAAGAARSAGRRYLGPSRHRWLGQRGPESESAERCVPRLAQTLVSPVFEAEPRARSTDVVLSLQVLREGRGHWRLDSAVSMADHLGPTAQKHLPRPGSPKPGSFSTERHPARAGRRTR
jgi:hypothetical protein